MKSKKIVLAGLLGLVLCIGLATTLAYFTDSDTQTNTVVMGNVDITLTEPEFSKNTDNTISGVVPRQEITKDPTITVVKDSSDAYIRLALSYEGLTEEQANEIKSLIPLNAGWKLVGNYIYFKDVVSAENVKTAFNTVVIPDWGNDVKDLNFKIIVKAEAVQADYFVPEKNDGYITGWPGVTVE